MNLHVMTMLVTAATYFVSLYSKSHKNHHNVYKVDLVPRQENVSHFYRRWMDGWMDGWIDR